MPLVRNPIGTGTRITLLVSRMKEEVWTFSNTPEEEFMNDGDLTIDAQVTANNQALASRLVQMVKDEFGQEGYDLAHIAPRVFRPLLQYIVSELVSLPYEGNQEITPAVRLANLVTYLTHDWIATRDELGVKPIQAADFDVIVGEATRLYHHRPLDNDEDRFKNLNIWLINLWNMAYPRVGSTIVGPRILTSLDPLGVAVDYYLQGYELETVWSVIN